MQLGETVSIKGLQAKPEYNGQIGRVESQDGERWGVRLRLGSDKISVRPANLTALPRYPCGTCGDKKPCTGFFQEQWGRATSGVSSRCASCTDAGILTVMEDEGAASVEGDDDPAVVNTETEIYRDLTYTGNPMLVEYEPTCAVCFCNQAAIRKPLLRCGACRVVWYCGPQHQRQDWKAKHKSCCGTLVATGSELSTPDVVEAQLAKAASLQQKLEEAAAEDVFTQQSLLRELAHLYEYRLDTEDSKTLATGFR